MYYYLVTILCFFSFCIQQIRIKEYKTFIIGSSYCFFCLLLIVSCFRYGVGTDFFNYKDIFDYNHPIEPLFSLFIKITKILGGNYSVFVFWIFAVTFCLKVFVFYKLGYKKGFFLSLMLYCSFYYIAYDINAIRQGMAMSVTLLACYYAYLDKKNTYIAICIIASLIHYTAIIFLPFIFLLKYDRNKKMAIILLLSSIFLSVIGIFDIIINIGVDIIGNNAISDRILSYSSVGESGLISFGTIRRLFFFSLIFFSVEKMDAPDRIKQIVYWSNLANIVIYFLFINESYFSTRLTSYYRIIECIWLSYFPFIFTIKNNKYIFVFFYFIYSLMQITSALTAEDNYLLPINTIFSI